jgi:hypothetical protein
LIAAIDFSFASISSAYTLLIASCAFLLDDTTALVSSTLLFTLLIFVSIAVILFFNSVFSVFKSKFSESLCNSASI